MPSKKSLERACKLRMENDWKFVHPRIFDETVADLLDEAIREARVSEAKLWSHNWYGFEKLWPTGVITAEHLENCRDCQRVAQLREGKT